MGGGDSSGSPKGALPEGTGHSLLFCLYATQLVLHPKLTCHPHNMAVGFV